MKTESEGDDLFMDTSKSEKHSLIPDYHGSDSDVRLSLPLVVLTSFRDAENWDGPKFSAARWQPRGLNYPELTFLAPNDPDTGRKMLEPDDFRRKYERVLENNSCPRVHWPDADCESWL